MSDPCNTALLVEDDARLASLIAEYLRNQGFEVKVEPRGDLAVARILKERPDVVILDWNLPGQDGLSVCREVRAGYRGPILMLTARTDELDQVVGLEVGADDYVHKPVNPRVLLARIRALLRRPTAAPTRFDDGDLIIEPEAREVSIAGQPVELSTAEFDLLWLLAERAGEVLSRDQILDALRGISYDGLDRSIDVRISKLRQAIGDDPRHPTRLKTVRGMGYLYAKKSR